MGSKEGAVVAAFTSQPCAQPESISGLGIILCGLSSMLLVLVLAPGGFSPSTPPQKTNISKFQFDLECVPN